MDVIPGNWNERLNYNASSIKLPTTVASNVRSTVMEIEKREAGPYLGAICHVWRQALMFVSRRSMMLRRCQRRARHDGTLLSTRDAASAPVIG